MDSAEANTARGSAQTHNQTQAQTSAAAGGQFESAMDDEYFQPEENGFIKLLGLDEISIETLFRQHKDKDKQTQKIMNEHANFIQVYEGYPEFIHLYNRSKGTHGGRKRVESFKTNDFTQDTGVLDFYEGLDFGSKFYSASTHCL